MKIDIGNKKVIFYLLSKVFCYAFSYSGLFLSIDCVFNYIIEIIDTYRTTGWQIIFGLFILVIVVFILTIVFKFIIYNNFWEAIKKTKEPERGFVLVLYCWFFYKLWINYY